MKYIKKVTVILGIILIAVGCGKKENEPVKNNVVAEVSEKVEKEEAQEEQAEGTKEEDGENEQVEETNEEDRENEQDGDIDYDLTNMGSDMVYATVYQFMVNPDDYIGKTIRMEGTYSATWYEPTSQYYHYCIIQDAMACCAQGMEFVWDDGSHVYPDEYPQENAQIVVTGVFETYQEEGDSNLYCRLKDATMEVEEKK